MSKVTISEEKASISDIPKIIKKSTQEQACSGGGVLLTVKNQLEVKKPAPKLFKILFKALGILGINRKKRNLSSKKHVSVLCGS